MRMARTRHDCIQPLIFNKAPDGNSIPEVHSSSRRAHHALHLFSEERGRNGRGVADGAALDEARRGERQLSAEGRLTMAIKALFVHKPMRHATTQLGQEDMDWHMAG